MKKKSEQADIMDTETLVEHLAITRNATIERCAQVVETYGKYDGLANVSSIAATIRKLKDAP